MRRRFNPWVVVLTAALTFGSLMAFVGPHRLHRFGYYGRHGYMHHGYAHGYDGYRNCDGYQRPDNRSDDFRRNSLRPEGRRPEPRAAEPNQADSL